MTFDFSNLVSKKQTAPVPSSLSPIEAISALALGRRTLSQIKTTLAIDLDCNDSRRDWLTAVGIAEAMCAALEASDDVCNEIEKLGVHVDALIQGYWDAKEKSAA